MSTETDATTATKPQIDPTIKAQWVAALRSGKYPQTTRKLRDADGFCCYGVLCELAVEAGIIPPAVDDGGIGMVYGENAGMPPTPVWEWAGMDEDHCPRVEINGFGDIGLQIHNDAGRTFAEIADAIEAQL